MYLTDSRTYPLRSDPEVVRNAYHYPHHDHPAVPVVEVFLHMLEGVWFRGGSVFRLVLRLQVVSKEQEREGRAGRSRHLIGIARDPRRLVRFVCRHLN